MPGTGKSLLAKTAGAMWGMPTLRVDMGTLYGKYQVDTEGNVRKMIAVAEAVAPCILFLDEVEKGLSTGDGSTDGGVSQRVLQRLLTWMNDKTAPVFIFATANNISLLPPEILRAGRFDAIFFVDLPNTEERSAIWTAQARRRGRKIAQVERLAQMTEGFSGAEIESAFGDAMFRAFAEDREVNLDDCQAAATKVIPLSKTQQQKLTAMREWANGKARYASKPESGVEATRGAELEYDLNTSGKGN
jgi:SpoVK/Ycf46/Vps4 family AAA+-type ATPase